MACSVANAMVSSKSNKYVQVRLDWMCQLQCTLLTSGRTDTCKIGGESCTSSVINMYVSLHMCSNVNSRIMINKHYRWFTGSELTFHVEAKSYKCVFSEDQVACMNCRGVQGKKYIGKVSKE